MACCWQAYRIIPFNFNMVNVPIGTELHFKANSSEEPTITAFVRSHNRITFEDREASLLGAAGEILKRRGITWWSSVAGPEYWYLDEMSSPSSRGAATGACTTCGGRSP